jgi:hypothetical protein
MMQPTIIGGSDKDRAYRRRLAANGQHQVVVALPHEIVTLLDQFQESQGLRNRSQAVVQLIERGRNAAQQ